MNKWIIGGLIAVLMVVLLRADQIGLSGVTAGKIVTIAEMAGDVPMRVARVQTANGDVQAVIQSLQTPFTVGSSVVLDKTELAGETSYVVTDFVRTPALIRLFAIFVILTLVVAGMNGVRSIFGLYVSIAIIFTFVLPQITMGGNPLFVTMMAALVIIFASYYLTHGFATKTTIAVVGTLAALIFTGVLVLLFSKLSYLTGFGSEEAFYLPAGIGTAENIYNLYLAGVMIGTIGVLDDITIAQAGIVAELAEANHKLGMAELFVRAMRIGHDHIGSLVNTLVLVYAGSGLPLLLLFINSQQTVMSLVNYEPIAEEIVRTLVGSMGLIVAVPLTTMIAAYWYAKR